MSLCTWIWQHILIVIEQAFGFAIFTSLATITIVLYNILSTRVTSLQKLYNHWAVLALDIFGVVFWLSTMALHAALRASFKPISISGCE